MDKIEIDNQMELVETNLYNACNEKNMYNWST